MLEPFEVGRKRGEANEVPSQSRAFCDRGVGYRNRGCGVAVLQSQVVEGKGEEGGGGDEKVGQ